MSNLTLTWYSTKTSTSHCMQPQNNKNEFKLKKNKWYIYYYIIVCNKPAERTKKGSLPKKGWQTLYQVRLNFVAFKQNRQLLVFRTVNKKKSGPWWYGILLTYINCAKKFADIFCSVFTLSLQLQRVQCLKPQFQSHPMTIGLCNSNYEVIWEDNNGLFCALSMIF